MERWIMAIMNRLWIASIREGFEKYLIKILVSTLLVKLEYRFVWNNYFGEISIMEEGKEEYEFKKFLFHESVWYLKIVWFVRHAGGYLFIK